MKKLILLAAMAALPVANAAYFDGSAGYLIDAEKAMLSGRIGFQFAQKEKQSHNLEFEAAYTWDKDYGLRVDIVPLMINYRFITPIGEKSDVFLGAGIGASWIDLSGWGQSDNDLGFTYQAFGGWGYRVSQRVTLSLGARFIDIGRANFFGAHVDVGNDTELLAALRIKF